MVEVLGIIIDRRPEGRPRKMENYTIEKIGCPYLNYIVKNSRNINFVSTDKPILC
jgi:hypothetical protein